MNKLSSYCGLTASKMRASENDLPVPKLKNSWGLNVLICTVDLLKWSQVKLSFEIGGDWDLRVVDSSSMLQLGPEKKTWFVIYVHISFKKSWLLIFSFSCLIINFWDFIWKIHYVPSFFCKSILSLALQNSHSWNIINR